MVVKESFRVEKDSMGEMQVPDWALYGASTQRAVLNFPISSLRFPRVFIKAIGLIKSTCAKVNMDTQKLDAKIGKAIVDACQEVIDGKHDDHFVVDIFQTGSGTSTNMNANEVIANRANEILGGKRGQRSLVHPNDHVNMGTSSNDVIPTAIHLACLMEIVDELEPALQNIEKTFSAKANEFKNIIKTGRTHLQDATPILLGQEFQGYQGMAARALERLEFAKSRLSQVALGGTAVGTGINTGPEFAGLVLKAISSKLGYKVAETTNHFQAQSTIDEVVETSGVLKTIACSMMKIANDIRWLGCGPRAGFSEIALPEVQPGSSIMPGKVNPVIAESLTMICAQVIGSDMTVAIAGQSGNFELNVMMPVAAYNLLQSITLLARGIANFDRQCVSGIKATKNGPAMVEKGLSLCTALAPVIGYDKAAKIAHIAFEEDKTIMEVALQETDLGQAELAKLLDPFKMAVR